MSKQDADAGLQLLLPMAEEFRFTHSEASCLDIPLGVVREIFKE